DLTGVAADADTSIKGRGTEPNWPLLCARLECHPQPNMMTLIGAATHRLLECKVLLPTVVKEIADRSVCILPVQQYALRDLQARFQCDRIRGIPPSQSPCPDNIVPAADATDVQRAAG